METPCTKCVCCIVEVARIKITFYLGSKNYLNILGNQVPMREEIFQKDNAPNHTAAIVKSWFEETRIILRIT